MNEKLKLFIKEYRYWITLLLVALILWSFAIFRITAMMEEREATFLENQLKLLESEINSVLKTSEKFSNYVFEKVVNKPEVLDIVSAAHRLDSYERDIYRENLLRMLIEDYELLQEFDFRQMHFSFPCGTTFLRVHNPEKYGDNIFSVRETVRVANTEQKYTSGFEEGRTYNGYRYVYPLFYNNEHIGSAEISMSLYNIIEILNDLYKEKDLLFILEKSIIEETIFDEELGNYLTCFISDDYMFDKEILEKIQTDSNFFNLQQDEYFFEAITANTQRHLDKKESFNFHVKYDDEYYLVQFLKMENISNKPVGYFISLSENNDYNSLKQGFHAQIFLITIIFLMGVFSAFLYTKDRIRLKKLSYIDQLTKIYNRHKFVELTEKELERNKRYGNNQSLLMIDLDYFKEINDTYGHNVGDAVLKNLTKKIKNTLRNQDIFARWGGEEFVVLLPETGLEGAIKTAERIRKHVSDNLFPKVGNITISIGVAEKTDAEKTLDDLINKADKALYRAKEQGRNKTAT